MMVHTFNPCTQMGEAGEFLRDQGLLISFVNYVNGEQILKSAKNRGGAKEMDGPVFKNV